MGRPLLLVRHLGLPLVAFRRYRHSEGDHLHPLLPPLQRLHPLLRGEVIEVTAGNAQVGVPELLLNEVDGEPFLSQLRRVPPIRQHAD